MFGLTYAHAPVQPYILYTHPSQLECGTTAQLCDLALRETSKKLLAAHKKKRAQDGIGAAAAWVQARICMPLLTRTEDKMAFVLYGSSKKMPAAHKFKK